MNVGNIDILNFLLCEDVRLDTTGKYILIGVTANGIQTAIFPANMPVAIYMDLVVPAAGRHEFQLRFTGPGEGSANIRLELDVVDPSQLATVVTPKFQILMERPGDLNVDASVDGKKWKNILRRTVSLAAQAPTFPPAIRSETNPVH